MTFEEMLAQFGAEMQRSGMTSTAAEYQGPPMDAGLSYFENDYSRPPQARPRPGPVTQPVEETLAAANPLIGAQMAGQFAGRAAMNAGEGEYVPAAGNALMAAMMMPGFRRGPAVGDLEATLAKRQAELGRLQASNNMPVYEPLATPMPAPNMPRTMTDNFVDVAPFAGVAAGAMAGDDAEDMGRNALIMGGAGLAMKGARMGYRAAQGDKMHRNALMGRIADTEADMAGQIRYGQDRAKNLPPALPPPGADTAGMKYQVEGWGQSRRSGYVDPAADPRAPVERPNPQAQRRAEASMRYQNSDEARRIAEAARNRDVEVFARNLDNPDELARNLRLYSDVSAQMGQRMSIQDIAQAMEARGLAVDVPQSALQPRKNGRFVKMPQEVKEFRDALWAARDARASRNNPQRFQDR